MNFPYSMRDLFAKNQKKQPNHSTPKKGLRNLFGAGAFCLLALFMVISPASAAETVNWTELTTVIDGFVGIIPSFGRMIGAVMPVLMTIAIYVFVLKFWDKILGAVDAAFTMFK